MIAGFERDAEYLSQLLRGIQGIAPARIHGGCTRNAYHLYMFRYDKTRFSDLSRPRFLQALRAEGIPCSGGYTPLNKEPFLKETLHSRTFRYIYSHKKIGELEERNRCPGNDRLCEEAVWFTQTMLMRPRQDMTQIAEAIGKIQLGAASLPRS